MAKRGGAAAREAAGLSVTSCVGWADEMRVGLRGTSRRVGGRRGVKVRQRLQLVYAWRSLVLVVDGRSGRLWRAWADPRPADEWLEVLGGRRQTEVEELVGDRAPSHRAGRVRAVGRPLVELPPTAPARHPAERRIAELRRAGEGRV